MLQLATGESAVPSNQMQFGQLFEQYHGLIFRTAYRITGNAADAEDILQTIFLRLVGRDSAAALHREESYLRRAAVNASIDLIRSRQADPTVRFEESPEPGGTGESNSEVKDCLRRAFGLLTPRAAEIFALRYFEDCSNQQIAKMLGISQVLVAVTLHRTRRQLQKEIHSYWGSRS